MPDRPEAIINDNSADLIAATILMKRGFRPTAKKLEIGHLKIGTIFRNQKSLSLFPIMARLRESRVRYAVGFVPPKP
jgi:hypothetical protein